jgi:hypothetical protein
MSIRNTERYANNYLGHRERSLARNAALKAETIAAYGGMCNCPLCYITEPRFLCVDHIFNDGAEERRKKLYGGSGPAFYMYLKRMGYPKDRYQLLCSNCNSAKREGKPCPHVIEFERQQNESLIYQPRQLDFYYES